MTEETGKNQAETSNQPANTPVEQQVEEKSEKALTQDEINNMIEARVARERAKFEKKYSGIDVDHYKSLVEAEEAKKQEELEKRGEYEKLLREQAEKFNTKIQSYEKELHSVKVDGTLLNEASRLKAVNPEQVASLLRQNLKLNEAGGVDVVDDKGQVRYDDNGNPLQVSQLVDTFLQANPHFKTAGPQGTGTQGAVGRQASVNTDLDQLNMKNPEHRAIYKKAMAAKGISL
jgi:hypothetical protein